MGLCDLHFGFDRKAEGRVHAAPRAGESRRVALGVAREERADAAIRLPEFRCQLSGNILHTRGGREPVTRPRLGACGHPGPRALHRAKQGREISSARRGLAEAGGGVLR